MSFSLNAHKEEDVVIIDMSGRLTAGEPVQLLHDTVHALLAEGSRKFRLDLRNVTFIDSRSVGELVSTYTTVRYHQGSVIIANGGGKAKGFLGGLGE